MMMMVIMMMMMLVMMMMVMMMMMMIMDHIYIYILKVHRHGISKVRNPSAIPARSNVRAAPNIFNLRIDIFNQTIGTMIQELFLKKNVRLIQEMGPKRELTE